MGIFDFLKPKPKPMASVDRVLDRGILLLNLKKHTDDHADSEATLEVRMGVFAILAAGHVLAAANITEAERNRDVEEGAALMLLLNRGLNTLLMMDRGAELFRTPAYQDTLRSLTAFSSATMFGFDLENPEPRCRLVMQAGSKLITITHRENIPMLEEMSDGWRSLLIDWSDQRIERLARSYLHSVDVSRSLRG